MKGPSRAEGLWAPHAWSSGISHMTEVTSLDGEAEQGVAVCAGFVEPSLLCPVLEQWEHSSHILT